MLDPSPSSRLAPTGDDFYWAVAQTLASHETLANDNLKYRGFETLLLKCRAKVGRTTRITALWPGYLLVKIVGGHFWMAKYAPGILRLLMRGDRPAAFPQAEFDKLMLARDPRTELVRLPKQKVHTTSFERGDTVRILTGSFRGLTAMYEGQTSQERIVVLLSMLGGLTRTELAADDQITAVTAQ